MPSNTPNLGLYKKNPSTDGNDTFDIKTMMNDNWDMIDTQVGGQLANAAPKPVTLGPGQQIVTADRDAPLNVTGIRGRTLVNLLGRDGNCEDTSKYTTYQSTLSTTTDTVVGINSIEATSTIANFFSFVAKNQYTFSAGKYYVFIGHVKSTSSIKIGIDIAGVFSAETLSDGTWQTLARKFVSPTTKTTTMSPFGRGTSVGQKFKANGIRIYEITAADYAAIDSMTAYQIAAKYPYFDDIKPVYAPYVYKYGKNLLPPFTEITTANQNGAVPEIIGPHTAKLSTTVTNQFLGFSEAAPAKPSTAYTLSSTLVSGAGKMYINESDKNGAIVAQSYAPIGADITVTTNANTVMLSVFFGDLTGTTTFVISNPMLNLGTTALPFEPRNEDYTFFPNLSLHSNLDGSIADQLYVNGDGQYRKLARIKELVLNGSLGWLLQGNYIEFKTVKIVLPSKGIKDKLIEASKYDGKILKLLRWSVDPAEIDSIATDGTDLHLQIANTDSGWGVDYSPTQDEIKAYFYGWKMCVSGSTNPYNGTGTKAWREILKPNTEGGDITTLPTVLATTYGGIFTPYRLQYELAQAVDEPVESEGSITLHEGANQIEVGNGVIVREHVTPYDGIFGNAQINRITYPLNNRLARTFGIYRNRVRDMKWFSVKNSDGLAYGNERWACTPANFDPSAVYEVTYLALDTYKLGIAPQVIGGEYTPNLRTSLDLLVRERAEVNTRISVLERGAAGKAQPQIIYPTLLNGVTNYGGGFGNVGYYKDISGFVHLVGVARMGALSTPGMVLFYLPVGYRPAIRKFFDTQIGNGIGGPLIGRVDVYTDGGVGAIYVTANELVAFDSVTPFLAEQ